jgi:predicted nucleic acid-binding protein
MLHVLIDSSAWIDHLKNGNKTVIDMIDGHIANKLVLVAHDMVFSELLLGGLSMRSEVYQLFKRLPKALQAKLPEFELFARANQQDLRGIGVIDTHLLMSCIISNSKLYTYDKTLKAAAEKMDLIYKV